MTCTAAAVLANLAQFGFYAMPPKGTVIVVPLAIHARYDPYEQRAARNCAARYGIVLLKGRT